VKRERDSDRREGLYAEIDGFGLVPDLRACLACGKCVGGCPVAAITPSYNSRQIIRDILAGNAERLWGSEEIWRCFWCAGCYMGCPVDIHFPLLMMELRYRALEHGYGLQYFLPFREFALKAREDGLTFAPDARRQKRIRKLRTRIGLPAWPEISEKARVEYRELFDLTGTTEWLAKTGSQPERPLRLSYEKGRIVP
jgi:heterodisulfide reductase subunit C